MIERTIILLFLFYNVKRNRANDNNDHTRRGLGILNTLQKVKKSEVKIKWKKNWHIFCTHILNTSLWSMYVILLVFIYIYCRFKTIKLYSIIRYTYMYGIYVVRYRSFHKNSTTMGNRQTIYKIIF